jgi:hypothetical protein
VDDRSDDLHKLTKEDFDLFPNLKIVYKYVSESERNYTNASYAWNMAV